MAKVDRLNVVSEAFESESGRILNAYGRSVIRKILKQFGLPGILDAVDIARDQYFEYLPDNTVSSESFSFALYKIGGICWNKRCDKPSTEVCQ